ncbi:MAG: hypothetical protein H7Y22_18980 [Gemmatimonadaceae bacterium]|nr:hypothetical protein [Gloeobacterales cyanobacterium ES-bin-141]
MNKTLLSLLGAAVFATAASASGAHAATAVRGLFASTAEGLRGQSPPVLKIWPGYSLDIDFLATGEVVRKIWHDGNRIAIDDDGCLVASSGQNAQSASQNQDCGARVLHLRQVVQPKDRRLTYGPHDVLTVITETPDHKFRRYKFQLLAVAPVKGKRGTGEPEYLAVRLVPDTAGEAFIETGGSLRATVDDVLRGLARANAKSLVPRNGALVARVNSFVASVRSGDSVESSAKSAGISMDLVTRLAVMGSTDQVGNGNAPKASSSTPAPLEGPSSEQQAEPEPGVGSEENEPTPAPSVQPEALPQSPPISALPLDTKKGSVGTPASQSPVALAVAASTEDELSRIRVPLKDGTDAPASDLLDVQAKIWHFEQGKWRVALGKFINALLETKDVVAACKKSGLPLNEVQYFLKSRRDQNLHASAVNVFNR